MKKIAIVGSRGWSDVDRITKYIRSVGRDVQIVSGGARGADSIAEKIARHEGLPIKIFLPNTAEWGARIALLMRNSEIVAYCDELIAFWDGISAGTKDSIDKAIAAKKHVTIFYPGVDLTSVT